MLAMNKKHLLMYIVFGVFLQINLYAQDFVVQVAAFSEPVDIDFYFGEKGVKGVYQEVDHNLIYRYYIGPYPDETFAGRVEQKTRKAGFTNARVVNLKAIREKCALSCAPIDGGDFIDAGDNVTGGDELFIRNIFFDFDRSHLREDSQAQLDKLYSILAQNPEYSAELHGHTDWVGSDDYNNALAKRRGQKAKNYVVAKGIADNRMIVKAFGEHNPVARNALAGGQDSEIGRQLNRRVEIRIVDSKGEIVWNAVEVINVPVDLKVD
jgi:outer membrane protein OmpA-like peptidoglycan-associated protein